MNTEMYSFRVALAQIRLGVLPLNNNIHGYSERHQRKCCPFCISKIEDETHFLYECPIYSDIQSKFLSNSVQLPLTVLLQLGIEYHRHNLSRFIFYSIKKRSRIMVNGD